MPEITKKRTPLYDTRSYTLENKDLSHGTWFSIIALGLAIYSSLRSDSPYLAALTSVICYLAVLLSSQRTRVAIPLILSVSLLYEPLRSTEILRLVIFSGAIALAPRRRESVAPLFVLLGLWAIFLNSMHIAQLFGGAGFAITPFYLKVAVLDICGFLVLLILLWSKPFPAFFGRLPREVDISTVSFVLFFLATVVGAALAATTLVILCHLDLETVLASSKRFGTPLTLIALSLVAIPLSLSVSLNRLVRDFSQKLESILVSGGRAPVQQVSPKVHEFQLMFSRARELIDELDRKVREAELIGKNTQAQFEEREKELIQATKDSQNIASVMSLSPVGFLAVNGSGAVLATNRTIDTQFGLNLSHDQIGEHYSQLKINEEMPAANAYSLVLQNFLARILSEQKTLARGQPLQSYTQLDAASFVHFTFFLFEERIIPVEWKRMSQQLPPSDLTIVLFSTVRDDLRSFFLEQFQPNSFEILGAHSIDLAREVIQQVDAFDQRHTLSPDQLEALRTCPPDELEAQLRILIRGASDMKVAIHSAMLDHLKTGQSQSQPQTDDEKIKAKALLSPINLAAELERLLRLFDELLGLSVETSYSFPSGIGENGQTVRQPINIQAIRPQVSRFFATLLAVLSGISKRVHTTLSVSLGTEQIGLGTAALFRGSHPGRYARITISHAGQSVTTNMLPESFRRISPNLSPSEELDGALALMSLEIERMNGFFSIQSSPVKGTHITIYIPEEPLNVQKPSARKLAASRIDKSLPKHADSEPAPSFLAANKMSAESQPAAPGMAPQEAPAQTGMAPVSYEEVTANLASLGQGPAGGEQASSRPSKVLIIGDEIGLREQLQSFLNGWPDCSIEDISREKIKTIAGNPAYSGSGFGSSDSASDLFGTNGADLDSFSLIIVPILGELSDGVRLLRDLGSERPILIVAKDSDSADALSALHPVLTYPLDQAALKDVVEGILNGR